MVSEVWAMAGGGAQQSNPMFNMLFIGIIFIIIWVLMIQPERRKQKELKALISNLKKGDKIVTLGGIHGTVTLVKNDSIVVRVDDHTKLEFDRQSVQRVVIKKEKEK